MKLRHIIEKIRWWKALTNNFPKPRILYSALLNFFQGLTKILQMQTREHIVVWHGRGIFFKEVWKRNMMCLPYVVSCATLHSLMEDQIVTFDVFQPLFWLPMLSFCLLFWQSHLDCHFVVHGFHVSETRSRQHSSVRLKAIR